MRKRKIGSLSGLFACRVFVLAWFVALLLFFCALGLVRVDRRTKMRSNAFGYQIHNSTAAMELKCAPRAAGGGRSGRAFYHPIAAVEVCVVAWLAWGVVAGLLGVVGGDVGVVPGLAMFWRGHIWPFGHMLELFRLPWWRPCLNVPAPSAHLGQP